MVADDERSEEKSDATASPFSGFGEYLRTQRQNARLSLRQLAELARVSNPYLSQIERGLHQPSITVVKSLADALNVSAEVLLRQAAGLAGEPVPSATEAAIRADATLSASDKETLLAVYRSLVDRGTAAAPIPETVVPRPADKTPAKKAAAARLAATKAATAMPAPTPTSPTRKAPAKRPAKKSAAPLVE